MEIKDYEAMVNKTAIYPGRMQNSTMYPTLGLCGEAGEVAEKVKKIFRDKGGMYSQFDKEEILKELGDVQYYVTALAQELGFGLSDVMEANSKKLLSRLERNKIHGNGDNR